MSITITRTRYGSEHKDIFYTLGTRHEVIYLYGLDGVLLSTHVTMEEQ